MAEYHEAQQPMAQAQMGDTVMVQARQLADAHRQTAELHQQLQEAASALDERCAQ